MRRVVNITHMSLDGLIEGARSFDSGVVVLSYRPLAPV